MHGVLRMLGKDTRDVHRRPTSSRCRTSTASSTLDGPGHRRRPTTSPTALVVFLDCGNIDRNPAVAATARRCASSTSTTTTTTRASARSTTSSPRRRAPPRSCGTSCAALGVEATPEIADALYVGLVTDTGKFMYENTGTRAHVMAAELIAAGVDVHDIYRRLYEGMPFAKLELLARALTQRPPLRRRRADAEPPDASTTSPRPAPRRATPRASSTTCARSPARRSPRSCASCTDPAQGRPLEGLAARGRRHGRRLGDRPRGRRRRAPPGRRLHHAADRRRARRVPARRRSRAARRCLTARGRAVDGVLLIDKPAGKTSHDVVAARAPRARRAARRPKVGHAGHARPVRDRAAARPARPRDAGPAVPHGRCPRRYETVARFGAVSTTGDREGEITETGAPIPDPLVLPTGDADASARRRTARSRSAASAPTRSRGAGRRSRCPSARSPSTRFEELWREGDARRRSAIECSSGTYVRSLVADLGDAYCEELRRTAIGPFDVDDADAGARRCRSATRSAGSCRSCASRATTRAGAAPRRRRSHGDRPTGRRAARRRRRPDRRRRAARRRRCSSRP